jgi:anti-sigma B factor antagonist
VSAGFDLYVNGRSIRLAGELDLASAPDLLTAIFPLTTEPGDLRIDMSELSFMDSSGLQALLTTAQALRGEIHVVEARRAVLRVFEITGTLDLFDFVSAGPGRD